MAVLPWVTQSILCVYFPVLHDDKKGKIRERYLDCGYRSLAGWFLASVWFQVQSVTQEKRRRRKWRGREEDRREGKKKETTHTLRMQRRDELPILSLTVDEQS